MSQSILPIGHKNTIPIGNLPFGAGRYDSSVPHKTQDKEWSGPVKAYMDEMQSRRQKRFVALVRSFGGQNEAMEKLGKSQSQISQLMNGKKPIGETLARDIEHTVGKPFGWLDSDEDGRTIKNLPQDPLMRELQGLWPQLPFGYRHQLVGRAAGWLQRHSESDAEEHQRA
jgi:transcriptional regulator with XRE-family HTH domain